MEKVQTNTSTILRCIRVLGSSYKALKALYYFRVYWRDKKRRCVENLCYHCGDLFCRSRHNMPLTKADQANKKNVPRLLVNASDLYKQSWPILINKLDRDTQMLKYHNNKIVLCFYLLKLLIFGQHLTQL